MFKKIKVGSHQASGPWTVVANVLTLIGREYVWNTMYKYNVHVLYMYMNSVHVHCTCRDMYLQVRLCT